ncbi:hypothetical protein ACH4SP_00170 [Streptomyces sp. NPDC021093]|uniref:hypothetical protein n=1 Tax=Streptomyces sp. NPDC021093 TaxID=3365112 RepID=UPI0037946E26
MIPTDGAPPAQAPPGRVLVVRVWFEPGAPGEGFRARVMTTTDIASGRPEESFVVGTPECVLEAARRWLARAAP